MAGTIQPFVKHSAEVNLVLMEVLAKRLGFREGLLAAKHRLEETSGSETRCIKNPPRPGGISEEKAALGAHTDFGSMVGPRIVEMDNTLTQHDRVQTFLHNRLGGLQVMPPGSDKWQYIKVSSFDDVRAEVRGTDSIRADSRSLAMPSATLAMQCTSSAGGS